MCQALSQTLSYILAHLNLFLLGMIVIPLYRWGTMKHEKINLLKVTQPVAGEDPH